MSIRADTGVLLQYAWTRTRIVVTPELVSDVFRVPKVEFPDYLGCEHLRTVSKDELISAFVSALLSGVSVSSLTVWAL